MASASRRSSSLMPALRREGWGGASGTRPSCASLLGLANNGSSPKSRFSSSENGLSKSAVSRRSWKYPNASSLDWLLFWRGVDLDDRVCERVDLEEPGFGLDAEGWKEDPDMEEKKPAGRNVWSARRFCAFLGDGDTGGDGDEGDSATGDSSWKELGTVW